jgi:NADH:ubiquinone oxidoreductase subunit 2 (subunit N)
MLLEATSHAIDSGALALFVLSYLFLVMTFVGVLALAWSLVSRPSHNQWPLPPRHHRAFRLAFVGLLAALGGFPPFFFLAPKLAIFTSLVANASWGLCGFLGLTLMVGWYVYWQGASGLFEGAAPEVGSPRQLSRGGGLVLCLALLGPIFLSGMLLDLWALAQWLA